MSAAMRLPLARLVTVPRGVTSTFSTSSPKRKVTAWSRRWNFSDSTTSGSQKSSIDGALLDHRHPGAECGEHRGVLDADHAGAHHHQRVGHLLDLQHAVRVEDPLVVELDV